jgi:hypothetical protein
MSPDVHHLLAKMEYEGKLASVKDAMIFAVHT